MILTLLLAAPAGCGNTSSHESPGPGPLVGAHRVKLRLEPGWHLAQTNLVPHLVNPKGILSVGTFPMQPGGRCAQAPSRAYSKMGPRDGLITILQKKGDPGFPPPPAHFQLHPKPRSFECLPLELDGQEFAFREAGRHFYAFVALGSRAPRGQAESILDTVTASR
jgi:hypothetical protein